MHAFFYRGGNLVGFRQYVSLRQANIHAGHPSEFTREEVEDKVGGVLSEFSTYAHTEMWFVHDVLVDAYNNEDDYDRVELFGTRECCPNCQGALKSLVRFKQASELSGGLLQECGDLPLQITYYPGKTNGPFPWHVPARGSLDTRFSTIAQIVYSTTGPEETRISVGAWFDF